MTTTVRILLQRLRQKLRRYLQLITNLQQFLEHYHNLKFKLPLYLLIKEFWKRLLRKRLNIIRRMPLRNNQREIENHLDSQKLLRFPMIYVILWVKTTEPSVLELMLQSLSVITSDKIHWQIMRISEKLSRITNLKVYLEQMIPQ